MKKPNEKWMSYATRISAFVLVAAAVIAYMFVRKNSAFDYRYEIDKPWRYATLNAPMDFPIYKTDKEIAGEKEKILESFYPYFKVLNQKALKDTILIVSEEDLNWLENEKYKKINLLNGKKDNSDKWLVQKLKAEVKWNSTTLAPKIDIVLDKAYTDSVRTQKLAAIIPTEGLIRKGEKIIERGEIVSEYHYQVLQSLARKYDNQTADGTRHIMMTIGNSVIVLLFLSMFVLYLLVFRPDYLRKTSVILFICLQMLIVIGLTLLLLELKYTVYFIPFVWIPILTRVFLDSRTALFSHITTVMILSVLVPAPEEFIFVQMMAGMIAVSSLSDMTRRAQLAQTAGWILLGQSLTYTALTITQPDGFHALDITTYIAFAVSAILTIGSYGLIYLFEKIFHFISSITLVELTDINSELLHSLAEKAPGTFQHSMQVSNLAAEAAKAIGANALLVRTGALYHDIGKMEAPLYFVENQQGGDNPLLRMDQRDAVKVIIAHVGEGEKLARKNHLPEAVINFITSHHGTSLVRYFYNTYCNNHPGEQVDEKLFRYPGNKPTTKEGAILMMADAIEARSRSLNDFSEASIKMAVNQMIDSQIADGQFSETPLSFKDVETIRRVFVARLSAMNHHRISYPTLNNGK